MMDRETVYQLALEHGVIDPDLGGPDNWMTDYGSCEAQLMAFARAAVLAEREIWDLLDKHGIQLSRNYIRDASGRFNGWWGCGTSGSFTGKGATMYEAAQACAAAIRKGE